MRVFKPLILSILVASVAHAAPDPAGRIEVTVLANPDSEGPRAVTVVGAEDLARRPAASVPDALAASPGVFLQKTARGHGAPIVRGLIGPHVLLLVDGVRLNDAGFRTGPNQYLATVPMDAVERIEVLRGPASVLYGSDALGGVVLIRTRRPPGLPGPPAAGDDAAATCAAPAAAGGMVRARWASAEASSRVYVETDGRGGPAAWTLGASYQDDGDLRAGRHAGTLPMTGSTEAAGDLGLAVAISPRWLLTARTIHSEADDVPRTHSTTAAVPYRGTAVGKDQDRRFDPQAMSLGYVRLSGRDLPGRLVSAEVTVSARRRLEGEIQQKAGSLTRTTLGEDVRGLGLAARAVMEAAPAHLLTVGLDENHDRIGSSKRTVNLATGARTDFPRGNLPDDTDYDAAGLYVQDEWETVPDRLDCVVGARWSWFAIRARETRVAYGGRSFGTIDQEFADITGGAGATLHATRTLDVVAGAWRGFRAPNADDLAALRETGASFDVPNPDLGPERGWTYEAGLRARPGPVDLSLTGYVSRLSGCSERVDATLDRASTVGGKLVQRRENLSSAEIRGVETSGRVAIGEGWSLGASFDWTWGTSEGEPLRRTPPARGALTLRREGAGARWWVEGVLDAVHDQRRLAPSDILDTERVPPGGTPGYALYGVRAGTRPSDRTSVTLAIENLADRDYRPHGSGLNGPGTNAVLAAEVAF